MRRGNVEFAHNGADAELNFRLMKEGDTISKTFRVGEEEFAKEFLEEVLKMNLTDRKIPEGVETYQLLIDDYFRSSAQLSDPVNPENSVELEKYLDTKEFKEVPLTEPGFPTKVLLEWDDETKSVKFEIQGLEEDLVRSVHSGMEYSPMLDHIIMTTVDERINKYKQGVQMRQEQQEAKEDTELKSV